jgi:hypothetical protein
VRVDAVQDFDSVPGPLGDERCRGPGVEPPEESVIESKQADGTVHSMTVAAAGAVSADCDLLDHDLVAADLLPDPSWANLVRSGSGLDGFDDPRDMVG